MPYRDTTDHDTEVRQCPGWWPNLVEAVCSCGWSGPTRDLNQPTARTLVRIDADEHLAEAAG